MSKTIVEKVLDRMRQDKWEELLEDDQAGFKEKFNMLVMRIRSIADQNLAMKRILNVLNNSGYTPSWFVLDYLYDNSVEGVLKMVQDITLRNLRTGDREAGEMLLKHIRGNGFSCEDDAMFLWMDRYPRDAENGSQGILSLTVEQEDVTSVVMCAAVMEAVLKMMGRIPDNEFFSK